MNKVALTVIVLSITIGASPFIANEALVEQETQFTQNMTAQVVSGQITDNGTRVGVNPGSNLDFGEIETGIAVTKFLEYGSSDQKRTVIIEVEGNISDKANVTERQFIEGEKRLPVAFKSDETGFYRGSLTLKTLTPEGDLGERWLEFKSRFY